MTTFLKWMIGFGKGIAIVVLCISALTITIQLTAVPAEEFMLATTHSSCEGYDKRKLGSWQCSSLPPISIDYRPSIVAAIFATLAIVWLVKGPGSIPVPVLFPIGGFFFAVPVFGRFAYVLWGAAKPTFLFGALPMLLASIAMFYVTFSAWPKQTTERRIRR